jgi:hypothetical protein
LWGRGRGGALAQASKGKCLPSPNSLGKDKILLNGEVGALHKVLEAYIRRCFAEQRGLHIRWSNVGVKLLCSSNNAMINSILDGYQWKSVPTIVP